ncbi:MAG: M48 family metalloprotease [Bacteroidota bacterium]
MKRLFFIKLCGVLLFVSSSVSSCRTEGKVIEEEIEVFVSEHHRIIGETMAAQIANMPEAFPLLDREVYADAYNYLDRLLSTLLFTSVVNHRKDFNWSVTILHDDSIQNSFTFPGGHIYVYTGLLKFLSAEHELMAVLGNEIAYADKEFSAIAMRDTYGGVFMGDIVLGKDMPELPSVVTSFPEMEFNEDFVISADQYAIDLICPFQYDVDGLQNFLVKAKANNIEWLKAKQLKELEFATRIEILEVTTGDCGEGGVTNLEAYQRKIKNFLPR